MSAIAWAFAGLALLFVAQSVFLALTLRAKHTPGHAERIGRLADALSHNPEADRHIDAIMDALPKGTVRRLVRSHLCHVRKCPAMGHHACHELDCKGENLGRPNVCPGCGAGPGVPCAIPHVRSRP